MSLKKIITIAYALILLTLFLPFVSWYVFDFKMFSMTGFELGFSLDSVLFMQVYAFCALAGIVLSLFDSRNFKILTTLCGVAALLSLGVYAAAILGPINSAFMGNVVVFDYGFYLAGLFTVIGSLLSFLNLQNVVLSGVPDNKNYALAGPQSFSPVEHQFTNTIMPFQDKQIFPPMKQSITIPHSGPFAGSSQSVTLAKPSGTPMLVGVSGQYARQAVDLTARQIRIGRDPGTSDLVYIQPDSISRNHCSVSYDYHKRVFILVDNSTNGTFLFPQKRLLKGKPVELESGTRFYISDPSEQFELRFM